jgi:two-component system, chemotaxis family, protein-glutamate methylesterase/glutaminase
LNSLPIRQKKILNDLVEIVVVGTSAGGLQSLIAVLSRLPAKFPIPILIVQHLLPTRDSSLAKILTIKTSLAVKQAGLLERILPEWVYIAPPDYHMTIQRKGYLVLSHAAPVHFSRPSADVLFCSAAEIYRQRVVGIILSGNGTDGSAGIIQIKKNGGYTIVEDPRCASHPGMPEAAVKTGMVDQISPLNEIHINLMERIYGGEGE